MAVTLTDLESWIDNAMIQEGISNYKLDVSGNSIKGDGYLGEVTFVKVTTKLGMVKDKDIYLVVKSAKKSDELRKQTPVKEAYEREIFMYTKVMPIFREFQKECALEAPFNKFARCFSASNENKREVLIMENLKMTGFEVHDRRQPQNLNHALLVFRSYGSLHAISLAMRIRKPALFKSLTKNMTDVMGKLLTQTNIFPVLTKGFETVIDILKDSGKNELADKCEGLKNGLEEYLTKYCDPNSPQSVILHGDCWNNNMMFKYEDGNRIQPVDMRFIDFQLSRVASPILDLSYYLYSCADKTVLDHFDFLLQAYHTSLSDSLKELGCNVDEILTYNELKQQWKKYGRYGLALTPLIIKIELCQSDEVVDFAESAEKGERLDGLFDFTLQDQGEYEKRLLEVFSHFGEKFL
ncbi:uncharacterized protein LOC108907572 [Anoplophora glabripennis]|uniref:uncharacterized protein LOC108907572 n=1 Tax=Anoplophora glabripennis TaxID=217634 RepID=UPI0008745416|nr:uncharacterized protein LOC108907572 [Anoplophora glabripennis]